MSSLVHRTLPLGVLLIVLTHAVESQAQQPTPTPRAQAAPVGPVRDPGGVRPPPSAPRTETATIAGTVVVAGSGLPAAGARVIVNAPDLPGGRSAITDNQGRFVIGSLPAGRYSINVSKQGYVTVLYGQRRPRGPATPVMLEDGETQAIAVQLPRGGVITGTVLDERGEPSINTYVRGMRFMTMNGLRRLQQSGGAQTDDRGIYRIHSLEPGDYVVCASANRSTNMSDAQRIQLDIDNMRRSIENITGPNAAAARQQMTARIAQLEAQLPPEPIEPISGYAPVCLPTGGSTASSPITIGPGDERAGVDLQLQLTPVARLEGTVIAASVSGATLQNIQITLVNLDETLTNVDTQGARPDPTGRFRFTNIAPGSYRILARSIRQGPPAPVEPGSLPRPNASSEKLWAAADVTVAGQDISNIVLEMQRGVSVSGHLVFQGTTGLAAPTDLSRIQVSVIPVSTFFSSAQLATNVQSAADAGGRFTITDVFPGRYRLMATSGIQGWSLDTAMIGVQETLDQPLEIRPGHNVSGAVLTFTDRPTELTGTIVNDKGQPAVEHTIVLYSADEKHWTAESRRVRATRATPDGKYTFRAIPSGEYRLAAVLDAEPGAWYDPAFLEALGPASMRISLGDGEKKVQNFRVSESQ
jgi:Carboxypeptidase regulatory-like domain